MLPDWLNYRLWENIYLPDVYGVWYHLLVTFNSLKCNLSYMYTLHRYSIHKNHELFSMYLSLGLCIDGTCKDEYVLRNATVPVPLCNTGYEDVILPGDGTVEGFASYLGDHVGETAVDVVLGKLGIMVRLYDSKYCL